MYFKGLCTYCILSFYYDESLLYKKKPKFSYVKMYYYIFMSFSYKTKMYSNSNLLIIDCI